LRVHSTDAVSEPNIFVMSNTLIEVFRVHCVSLTRGTIAYAGQKLEKTERKISFDPWTQGSREE